MILLSSIFTIFSLLTTSLLIDNVTVDPNSTPDFLDIENSEFFTRNLGQTFLCVLVAFGIICFIRRQFLIKKAPKNVQIHQQKLKIGVFGLFFCAIVQRFAWWYMKGKFMIGFPAICISDISSMLIFLIFILEGASSCDIKYRQWKEYFIFTMVFTVISTYTMLKFVADSYDLVFHLVYSISVAVYIIDIHVLSCNQIRVTIPFQMEHRPKKPQENQLFLGESFMV